MREAKLWENTTQERNGWFPGNGWPDTSMTRTFGSARCRPLSIRPDGVVATALDDVYRGEALSSC
jgi:hypothetical protein